jgi:PAS domain S-box-containing protein
VEPRDEKLKSLAEELQAERAQRVAMERALENKEAEFLDFVENGALGLHRVAGDGTILWANKAELDLLGYAADEYVGKHIANFHAEQPVIEDILMRLSDGQTICDYPATLRCKDGSIKHVLIHSNARFKDGQLESTRCFTRDVTDIVQARALEAQLHREREEMVERLQSADKAKDEFLAILGHELRNPLAPIVTAMNLLERRGLLDETRELKVIDRQVRHMVRLVDDLLDVQRIIKGDLTLRMENVQIAEVIHSAVEAVSTEAEAREQTLLVHFSEQNMIWNGDPSRLVQIVSNLLTNASRYSPARTSINLTVDKQNDAITIAVRDEGQGISQDQLKNIFQMFYRAPQTANEDRSGLGIGLAVTQSLVVAHGGNIEARSGGIGNGSEFIVRLPANTQHVSAVESPRDPGAGTGVKHRILVIDDNRDAADIISEILIFHGHTVTTTYDPSAALTAARQIRPDVILTDIGLPVIDGYELARLLREELKDQVQPRIFAISGFGQALDKEKSREAGFAGHFVKPVSFDALVAAIEQQQ